MDTIRQRQGMKRGAATGGLLLLAAALTAGVAAPGCVSSQRPTATDGCSETTAQCHDNTVQHCEGGVWVDKVVCPTPLKCAFGQCAGQDTGCGDHECGEDSKGAICGSGTCELGFTCNAGYCVDQDCTPLCGPGMCGDDGCGGTCWGCVSGETCQDGLCVAGGQTCEEVLYCALGFGGGPVAPSDPSFPEERPRAPYGSAVDCIDSTGVGLAADQTMMDVAACVDLCSAKSNPKDCVVRDCGGQVAACLYPSSGDKSCSEIATCAATCFANFTAPPPGAGPPLPTQCLQECGSKGLPEAQAAFASLELCLVLQCSGSTDADTKTCATSALSESGPCGDAYVNCTMDMPFGGGTPE